MNNLYKKSESKITKIFKMNDDNNIIKKYY